MLFARYRCTGVQLCAPLLALLLSSFYGAARPISRAKVAVAL